MFCKNLPFPSLRHAHTHTHTPRNVLVIKPFIRELLLLLLPPDRESYRFGPQQETHGVVFLPPLVRLALPPPVYVSRRPVSSLYKILFAAHVFNPFSVCMCAGRFCVLICACVCGGHPVYVRACVSRTHPEHHPAEGGDRIRRDTRRGTRTLGNNCRQQNTSPHT